MTSEGAINVGIPVLLSVAAGVLVGVGGFLLGWRWPRSAARREGSRGGTTPGALPWSLIAVGLVAVAATSAFFARYAGAQPASSAAVQEPIADEEPIADDETTRADEQTEAGHQLPEQTIGAPTERMSEPRLWPALPDCFEDDYLVHETASARQPHFVAENKSSVFTPVAVVSMMLVDADRIIGGLRISHAPGQRSFGAHDVVDASCASVAFSTDEGDPLPDARGTGQLAVAFTLEGQPYELEIQKHSTVRASATLRPAE